jgi:hypothetical protein
LLKPVAFNHTTQSSLCNFGELTTIDNSKNISGSIAMQQRIPVRICIYAKDVMNITGRKERAARKLLAQIRKKYKKKKGQFITVTEFCEFTGIHVEIVLPYLK